MRQLAPLIVRRVGPFAEPFDLPEPWASAPAPSQLLANVKLFVLGWLGGLVFFGTYLS